MVWASGPAPASRYSAWLNKQQRAGRGREGRRGLRGALRGLVPSSLLQAGWPRRRRYRGSPFCLASSEWGQLLLSGGGASAHPRKGLYKDPPISQLPRSSPTKRPSLTHTCPSIHLQCQISWGCAVFCRCPGERVDVQPEEERTFIVSVARQKRFLLPL